MDWYTIWTFLGEHPVLLWLLVPGPYMLLCAISAYKHPYLR